MLALADAWIDSTTWALYRVRRRFTSPAHADRGLVAVHRGTRAAMETAMVQLAHRMGIDLATTDDGHPRLVLRERAPESYPYMEEFYVACLARTRSATSRTRTTRPAGWPWQRPNCCRRKRRPPTLSPNPEAASATRGNYSKSPDRRSERSRSTLTADRSSKDVTRQPQDVRPGSDMSCVLCFRHSGRLNKPPGPHRDMRGALHQ